MNIFELAMLKKNKGGGSGGGSSAPADWNASEGEAGYVKNRTHYVEKAMVEVVPETTMILNTPESESQLIFVTSIPAAGSTVKVVYDGVEYSVIANVADDGSFAAFGNVAVLGAPPEISADVPFAAMIEAAGAGSYECMIFDVNGEGTHTFSISYEEETVHKIDPKYLPEGVGYESVESTTTGTVQWDGVIGSKPYYEYYLSGAFGNAMTRLVRVSGDTPQLASIDLELYENGSATNEYSKILVNGMFIHDLYVSANNAFRGYAEPVDIQECVASPLINSETGAMYGVLIHYIAGNMNRPIAAVFYEAFDSIPKGTYLCATDKMAWADYGAYTFELALDEPLFTVATETVHKIDPKYLPDQLIVVEKPDEDIIYANMTFAEARTLLNEGKLNSFVYRWETLGRVEAVSTQFYIEAGSLEDCWIIHIQMASNAVITSYKWELADGILLHQYANEK